MEGRSKEQFDKAEDDGKREDDPVGKVSGEKEDPAREEFSSAKGGSKGRNEEGESNEETQDSEKGRRGSDKKREGEGNDFLKKSLKTA